MSNEEHVEEMYYFAHLSGVFKEFSEKVTRLKEDNPKHHICDITQYVYEEFTREGLINNQLSFVI